MSSDMKRMATNLGHKTGQYFSKVKEKSQVKVIEQQIQSRQKRFGIEFLALRERGAPRSEQQECLAKAKKDIAILRGRAEGHEEAYAAKKADVKAKIGGGGRPAPSSSPAAPKTSVATAAAPSSEPKARAPRAKSPVPRAKAPAPRAKTPPRAAANESAPRSKNPVKHKPSTTDPAKHPAKHKPTTAEAPRSRTPTKHKPTKHKPAAVTPTSSPAGKPKPVKATAVPGTTKSPKSKPKPVAATIVPGTAAQSPKPKTKTKPVAATVVHKSPEPKTKTKPVAATVVHKSPEPKAAKPVAATVVHKSPKPKAAKPRAHSPTRPPQKAAVQLSPKRSPKKQTPNNPQNLLGMFGDQLNPANFLNLSNHDDDSPYGHTTDAYGQPKPRKPYKPAPVTVETEGIPPGFENTDPSKWSVTKINFKGAAKYDSRGYQEKIEGVMIQDGINQFQANPGKYVAMWYHKVQLEEMRPGHACKFTYLHREGTVNYRPIGVPDGHQHCLLHEYSCLPRMPGDELPMEFRDEYTDHMSYLGQKLHDVHRPILPGRGMGVGDSPLLKIIGEVDPGDTAQGKVGDCWLLSGIASVAEFDGVVRRLFRKTEGLSEMPRETPNKYTITLWDLAKWQEVDVVIDERLAVQANGKGLLGSKLSDDGELWVPYLEKAIACHCGGWDKINGGQCTHAWALLTGIKEQYTFKRTSGKKWGCFAKYDTSRNKWAKHRNSPWDTVRTMWRVDWPEAGGGGEAALEVSEKDLFRRMETWHGMNFMVAAGTQGDSDENTTGGLVDNHAYSVIETHTNVAGTGVDLLKLRNPWGKGEIENGQFDDTGPGWEEYPEIKKALKPTVGDDGVFWVTRKEFFKFFVNIFLCAHDMTTISSVPEEEEESEDEGEESEDETEEEDDDEDEDEDDESESESEDDKDDDESEDDEDDDDESDEEFVEQIR